MDTESLFEYDGALLRLYFQPTLYLEGSREIRWGSRLPLCGPAWLQPAPPAGAETSLHHIITLSGFDSAGDCFINKDGKNPCGMNPAGS